MPSDYARRESNALLQLVVASGELRTLVEKRARPSTTSTGAPQPFRGEHTRCMIDLLNHFRRWLYLRGTHFSFDTGGRVVAQRTDHRLPDTRAVRQRTT